MTPDPVTAPEVVAEFLAIASEAGPERLVEIDRLLRSLLDDETVNAAHAVWTTRLRRGVSASDPFAGDRPEPPGEDVFQLTRRVRATAPASGPSKWSGRHDGGREAERGLVRCRPDPRDRGRDGRDTGTDGPEASRA